MYYSEKFPMLNSGEFLDQRFAMLFSSKDAILSIHAKFGVPSLTYFPYYYYIFY